MIIYPDAVLNGSKIGVTAMSAGIDDERSLIKTEAAILLYSLISLSDIQRPQMFREIQGDLSLMKDFAGEVLTDLGEILDEYL